MTKLSSLQIAKKHKLPVPDFIEVSHHIPETELSAEINKMISKSNLKDCDLFSVRSSANVEDAVDKSYAGQFMTKLFVKRKDLISAIIECRKSANVDNLTDYDDSKTAIKMDIIVQRMINASISGVVFSANPNGMLNEAVINITRHAGTAVKGDEPTTTYYYHFDDELLVEESQSTGPKLDSHQFKMLINLLNDVMKHFGKYVDVEFAIDQMGIWLLQVRPITTIELDNLVVLDNHNISESYPGISLPLTQSFSCLTYTDIFRRLLVRMIGESGASRYKSVATDMVKPLNGRMYYQVSNWYAVLDLLPFRNKIFPVWERMIGVDIQSIQKDIDTKKIDRIRMLLTAISLNFSTSHKMKRLHVDFKETVDVFEKKFNNDLSLSKIIKLFDWLRLAILKDWDITLVNDMDTFIYTELYRKFSSDDFIPRSDKILPSAELAIEFSQLRELLHKSDDFDTVCRMDKNLLYKYIEDSSTTLAKSLAEFIKQYGDRVPGELKLETLTFRTNPELLIKELVECKLGEINNKPSSHNGILSRFFYRRATRGIYHREQSRLDRSRIFGMVRSLVLLAGKRLNEQDCLDDGRDIFYLTLDELRKYNSIKSSYRKLVIERKPRFNNARQSPSYTRMVFPHDGIVERWLGETQDLSGLDDEKILHGIACSSGVIEAEAVVVLDIANTGDVTGKVLVAETTDPGWVFLLSRAKGIVTEKGSLLSHAAIISRELHIPSVVGVANATRLIKDGDIVRVDGLTGEVRIVK